VRSVQGVERLSPSIKASLLCRISDVFNSKLTGVRKFSAITKDTTNYAVIVSYIGELVPSLQERRNNTKRTELIFDIGLFRSYSPLVMFIWIRAYSAVLQQLGDIRNVGETGILGDQYRNRWNGAAGTI